MPTKIAIDGPAGTGKSTVARLVAEALKLPYLNTGQLYRAVAYSMLARGDDPADDWQAGIIASYLEPTILNGMVVELSGDDVRGLLDADDVSNASSIVAAHARVRSALTSLQQNYAAEHGAVMEGRDIGSVILPDAQFKFFLVCDPEERVRRRIKDGNFETVEELAARDKRDSERASAPLTKVEGAIEIDTTNLTIEEVVDTIMTIVNDSKVVT